MSESGEPRHGVVEIPCNVTFADFFKIFRSQNVGHFEALKAALQLEFEADVVERILGLQDPDSLDARTIGVLAFIEEKTGFRHREMRHFFPMLRFLCVKSHDRRDKA